MKYLFTSKMSVISYLMGAMDKRSLSDNHPWKSTGKPCGAGRVRGTRPLNIFSGKGTDKTCGTGLVHGTPVLGFVVFLFILVGLFQGVARADEDVNVGVFVNYGYAYRDGSWVPVDVVVQNKSFDISGWVEVKTFSASGTMQSPVYRVPAHSPKGSKKRFRLICYFDNTTRVEVQLYNGKRSVLDFPVKMQTNSIRPTDFLALVLDNDVSDYGFLSTMLQTKGKDRRIYRENLKNETLSLLADYPQCYKSFDAIILGDIDPKRIGKQHRDLLTMYVEQGGALIVMIGEDAPKYKGTWVEKLLDIEIGPTETIKEVDLAAAVFSDVERAGANPNRESLFAKLTPTNPEVKVRGGDKILATMKPIGNGLVAAVAVDASSYALRDSVGYANLWRELCSSKKRNNALNFRAAAEMSANDLPRLIGIEIQPRSSVMLYLFLYIGIGIILNWYVCNRIKRRELAWVFLIVFSTMFTAYAMVFGTVGRAKSSEIEKIGVLQISRGSDVAELHSLVGIITARTSRYSAKLPGEFALARDVSAPGRSWRRRRGYDAGTVRPFYMVQGTHSSIDDILIRASEMRLIHTEDYISLSGGIEGHLIHDENGIHGTLENKTGYDLEDTQILINGRIYEVKSGNENMYNISLSPNKLANSAGYYKREYSGSTSSFKKNFMYSLFSDINTQTNYYDDRKRIDDSYGPYLIGWASVPVNDAIAFNKPVKENIRETLLIAEVAVERKSNASTIWFDLPVRFKHPHITNYSDPRIQLRPEDNNWRYRTQTIERPANLNVDWTLPDWFVESGGDDHFVDLYWSEIKYYDFIFYPACADKDWSGKHLILKETNNYDKNNDLYINKSTYKIDDWRSCLNEETGNFEGIIKVTYFPDKKRRGNRNRPNINYSIIPRVKLIGKTQEEGDWSKWR